MAYVVLAVAIVAEVFATVALKLSEGFTKPWPSVVVVVGYVFALGVLSQALKLGLPVGVAYAIWAGAGVALVALIGTTFLGEHLTLVQLGGLALIIGGVAALNLGGAH